MLDGRAGGAVAERLVDPRRMEREVLADARVVHGDAGVLAHEVLLTVRDLDVPVDRLQHTPARDRRLTLARGGKGVTQVLRDVLQRPHVQVGRRVLDDVLQVEGDGHARAFSAAARPARRPKTTHSSSEFPIMRLRPWVPPAISPHA